MMRTSSSVDFLLPRTRQAILAATFGDPQRWWYMRELARHLRVTPSSLQRELVSLVRGGILLQKRDGKHVYFKAAANSPIFPELQGFILKTVGLADVIRGALRPLTERIQWAFIYGSAARSEGHAASDVDLMMVGRVGLADIANPLRKAERRLNRAVNPIVYTFDELKGKLKSNHHFVSSVLRSKKLFILGEAREFARAFGQ
jgi:DNA-binding transcriptional ArsR family regulator